MYLRRMWKYYIIVNSVRLHAKGIKMLEIMENEELAIGQVKSLRLVHFYHIIRDSESVPAVMIYYDRDKVLNLCRLDKYYDKLLEKIWKVYKAEKNANLIITDEYSKAILDQALAEENIEYDKMTEGYAQMLEPLCHHAGYMKGIVVPVLKYVITQLYELSETKILWNPVSRDWFGKGDLAATVGDKRQVFPYRVICPEAGTYLVHVGNIFKKGNTLAVGIDYKKSGVDITFNSETYPVEGYINHEFQGNELYRTADVSINKKRVHNSSNPVKKAEAVQVSDNVKQILNTINSDSATWMLPWGQEIALNYQSEVKENVTEIDGTVSYVTSDDRESIIYSVSYRDIELVDQVNYTIYNFAMDMYEDKGVNGYCQMHFSDVGYGAVGYYKSYLAGKYFKAIERVME